MAPKLSAAVLVGGESRRMGENKALLKIDGKTLVERVVLLLQEVFAEVFLVGNDRERYRFLNLPVVGDVYRGCGPLAGVHAALLAASHPYVFVAACDMPFLNRPAVAALLAEAPGRDAVVPKMGEYCEPLCAVYAKGCLPAVEEHLQKGIYKISALYPRLDVKFVEMDRVPDFNPEVGFFNVNTPEDLERAASLFRRGCGGRK